jgi:hypothetical protein
MSRWSDLAVWRGPSPNQSGAMKEQRGLVVHIASGFAEGTISWQKNPDANVSSHFVVGRDGKVSQLVDTGVTAWTQRDGNGHWLSVECEGFAADDRDDSGRLWLARYPGWDRLTDAQVTSIAFLLMRGHQQYGYPLTLAHDPTGRGLGYHSMGAEHNYNWGHLHCPGEPIKAQLPTILSRAQQLAGGTSITSTEDDMAVGFEAPLPGTGTNDAHKAPRSGTEGVTDLWLSLGAGGYNGWQTEQLRNSRAAMAAIAGLTAKLDALTAAFTAMATGGTSVDTAAILAHIDEKSAAESEQVAELTEQVADLQHKLAAAGSALGE